MENHTIFHSVDWSIDWSILFRPINWFFRVINRLIDQSIFWSFLTNQSSYSIFLNDQWSIKIDQTILNEWDHYCIWSGNKAPKFRLVRSEHSAFQKISISKSRVKTMLILFFDSKGVIHHEYVSGDQTVKATFYIQVLGYLCKLIVRVRPEIWRDWKFFLLHDNAHSHTAAIVPQFLTKKGVAQSNHSPYSRI